MQEIKAKYGGGRIFDTGPFFTRLRYTSLLKQTLLQLMHHKYGTRGKSMLFSELLLCGITLQYLLPVLRPDKVYKSKDGCYDHDKHKEEHTGDDSPHFDQFAKMWCGIEKQNNTKKKQYLLPLAPLISSWLQQ